MKCQELPLSGERETERVEEDNDGFTFITLPHLMRRFHSKLLSELCQIAKVSCRLDYKISSGYSWGGLEKFSHTSQEFHILQN